MTRTAALASLSALAAGVARAGSAAGGGDNMTIAYSASGAGSGGTLRSQFARPGRFAGGHGDGPPMGYEALSPGDPGRGAWMVGGGGDAEVVHGRRR